MTIIWIYLKDGIVEVFKNYKQVVEHIQKIENMKLIEDHPEFAKTAWSFIIHSPEQLAQHRQALEKVYDEKILTKAFVRQLSLLEICEGDYTKPRQILLTRNVGMKKLRQAWCQAYSKAHYILIMEIKM